MDFGLILSLLVLCLLAGAVMAIARFVLKLAGRVVGCVVTIVIVIGLVIILGLIFPIF